MKFLKLLISRVQNFLDKYLIQMLILSFLLVGSIIVLWPIVIHTIPAGSIGVVYRPLQGGVDLNKVYREGYSFIWPWDTLTQYDGRIQTKSVDIQVMTSDSLKTNVKVVYQYEVNASTLPYLHRYVGPDYQSKIIEPLVISSAREKIAKFTVQNAFTTDLSVVLKDIAITADQILLDNISPPGFDFIKLIRIPSAEIVDISLPQDVQKAIESKIVDSEKASAYQFILEAERQEAKRKMIEAEGIAKFQDIVRPGLTDNYLRWRGVEATQKLAESNNSKIIMFGSGSSGLPLILGDMDKNNNAVSNKK
jgi:regulator of protease activity HflC (stomatin/prohibitin superfamily)